MITQGMSLTHMGGYRLGLARSFLLLFCKTCLTPGQILIPILALRDEVLQAIVANPALIPSGIIIHSQYDMAMCQLIDPVYGILFSYASDAAIYRSRLKLPTRPLQLEKAYGVYGALTDKGCREPIPGFEIPERLLSFGFHRLMKGNIRESASQFAIRLFVVHEYGIALQILI